ncbi:MAG: glutathione S-transferase [Pararhodobacter sp.]|nr:glutathione S-transferase [Pararhodobacter sp.]
MLTLHHSPASPYVRKVMVLLHETGQTGAVTLVPAAGNPVDPGSMPVGLNPLGKIPALERADGCTLYDSRVICRFLAARSPEGAAFYPPAPRLWEVLTLEATADGMLDAALAMRYEQLLRPEEDRLQDWIEGQWAKIMRSLDALEARWTGHLAGPACIGQIALGCALGYLDFRFADRPWREGRPALTDWQARFALRPSMQATLPQG